ncbi:MAG: mraY [Parcubacteria group bacterium]|nr:mraY [Parcubacteria group bacterium]
MIIADVVKVFIPPILSFVVGLGITVPITHYLYKYKLWKKSSIKKTMDGKEAPITASLHGDANRHTPNMGGTIVWISTIIVTLGIWLLSKTGLSIFEKLDFTSRSQTWIPLFTLVMGGVVGLVDDFLTTREAPTGAGYIGGGLSLGKRLSAVAVLGLFSAWWFYNKLGIHALGLPGGHSLELGILFVPLFIIIVIGIYSGSVIDGIDGLSGGLFAAMFSAYAGIAFYQQQINLAAFCAVVVGGILAFLWFNIPPARFYMSETGMMGLTITLAVVAFMTDNIAHSYGVLVLPIIALPLIVTTASNIIQLSSKRLRGGKKVFLVAPLHNHFQAAGWPSYKVTMRYWVAGVIFAILGFVLALL